jgi:hypothetical protein
MHRCPLLLAVGAVIVAGCSNDPAVQQATAPESVQTVVQTPTEDPTTSPTPSPSPDEAEVDASAAREYFEAMAGVDPEEQLEAAETLAVAGSPAQAYARHQAHMGTAYIDGGSPRVEVVVQEAPDGLALCDTEFADLADCAVMTDIQMVGGKVQTFSVGDEPLKNLVTAGDDSAVAFDDLGDVTFLTAYKSATGHLFVTAEVQSGSQDMELGTWSAVYRDPSGRQITAAEAGGPSAIAPDSHATTFMTFPAAEPGGTVTLEAYDAEFNAQDVQIKIG